MKRNLLKTVPKQGWGLILCLLFAFLAYYLNAVLPEDALTKLFD